jgi:hypothetical protein
MLHCLPIRVTGAENSWIAVARSRLGGSPSAHALGRRSVAPCVAQKEEARYHGSPARLALTPNPSDFVDTATLDMVDAVS